MHEGFAIFILTHGRADKVYTHETLRKAGYSGPIYIVIDNEDKCGDEYRKKYGDKVLVFDKDKVAREIDEADNFDISRKSIVYARNAVWQIARDLGFRYFMQMDDDYVGFEYRYKSDGQGCYYAVRKTMDKAIDALLHFFKSVPALSIAMAQGGDLIGGTQNTPLHLKRKAMNSFICDTHNSFTFCGRINEDVNAYTMLSRMGHLFFTVMQIKLVQKQTQSNAGGMTGIYEDTGTYLKTFYTVMHCPSCVKVGVMGDHHFRIHHEIDWNATAPRILSENHKKAGAKT